jgi:hypothetical protein
MISSEPHPNCFDQRAFPCSSWAKDAHQQLISRSFVGRRSTECVIANDSKGTGLFRIEAEFVDDSIDVRVGEIDVGLAVGAGRMFY